MGAWGYLTFEDDESLDWLSDLCDQDSPSSFLKECLNLKGIDYLEYQACTGVLCAAVMIDGLLNGPAKDLPEEAIQWLASHPKLRVSRLVAPAISGLERLLGGDAELHELWKENRELYPKWKMRIQSLKRRLKKLQDPEK